MEVANESDLNQFISADVGSGRRVKKVSRFKQLVQKPGIRLGTTYRDTLEGMDLRLLKRELRKLQPDAPDDDKDKMIEEVIEAKTTTLYQKDTETLKVLAKQIDETIKEESTREDYINVIKSDYETELEGRTKEELGINRDSKKLTKNELIERIIFEKTEKIKENGPDQKWGEKEIIKELNKEMYILSGKYTIAEATSIVNGMWLKNEDLIGIVKTNIKPSELSDKITGFTFKEPLVNAMKGDKIHIYFVGYLPEMTPDPLWNSYVTVEDEEEGDVSTKSDEGGTQDTQEYSQVDSEQVEKETPSMSLGEIVLYFIVMNVFVSIAFVIFIVVSKDPNVSFEFAATTFVTGTYGNVEKITDDLFQNIEGEVQNLFQNIEGELKNLWTKIVPK